MDKLRVMYIVHHFPQISETYIRTELEALEGKCEIKVISLNRANSPYKNHVPYALTDDPAVIRETIEDFGPDVLHSHWLGQVPTLAYFGGYYANSPAKRQIPFTVRSHSFDVLDADGAYAREAAPIINSDLCLGILNFPFARPYLEHAGMRGDKLHDCFPVVNYRRFLDRSPNGGDVMNVGACLPKKQMDDFLKLASKYPSKRFDLYAMGYNVAAMERLNRNTGAPVTIVPPVEPESMPAEYKKHEWLVYTAAPEFNTVGWPMAVAEAQASGVGVCVPNLRPDMRDYVGKAGFLYDSINDVVDIIAKPFPQDLRELGFEQAKKSDALEHIDLLLNLWRQAAGRGDGVVYEPSTATAPAQWEWKERYSTALSEIARLVPGTDTVLLADEAQLGPLPVRSRMIPFPEQEGQYAGPPANDDAAIRAFEQSRRSDDAGFMIFAWPAFWWLDHYAGLHNHLRVKYRCVLENETLVVFDLRQ
jgi:hypothetical protein